MFAMNVNGDEFGDPDVVLLETVGAGVAPDWQPDEEVAAALESQLLSIGYLMEDMFKEGGMNKQLAMEMHRIVPDSEQKYPAGFFTNHTSATLYQPALEELHTAWWVAIGAVGTAIAAIIWKFVRWIIRKWNGESGGSIADDSGGSGRPSDAEIDKGITEATQAAEQKVQKQDQIAEDLKEATPVLKEAVEAAEQAGVMKALAEAKPEEGEAPVHVKSFEDAAFMLTERHMNKRYEHLVNLDKNSWFDILHEGRWTKLMLSLGPILSSIEGQLMQRVQVFESIFSVTQTEGDPVRHKNALDLIEKAKVAIQLPGTNYHSLEQLARSLDRPEGMMSFNAGKEKLRPVIASDSIARMLNSSNYKSLLQARVKFIQKLAMFNKAQIKLGEISHKWNAQHPGQGVGVGVPKDVSHAMAPAITQLKRDLLFMMQINTAIEHFLDEVDSLNLTLASWWSETWTAIEHYAVKNHEAGSPKIEMPVEVQKAKGMMTFLRRAMGKVPASDLGGGLAKSAKDLLSKAVNAGAAPHAGSVQHPKNAVAPGMGARQIPTKEWQKK